MLSLLRWHPKFPIDRQARVNPGFTNTVYPEHGNFTLQLKSVPTLQSPRSSLPQQPCKLPLLAPKHLPWPRSKDLPGPESAHPLDTFRATSLFYGNPHYVRVRRSFANVRIPECDRQSDWPATTLRKSLSIPRVKAELTARSTLFYSLGPVEQAVSRPADEAPSLEQLTWALNYIFNPLLIRKPPQRPKSRPLSCELSTSSLKTPFAEVKPLRESRAKLRAPL